MNLKVSALPLLLLVGVCARPATAQIFGNSYYHAATEAESAANGMANVISAAGQANLLNSVAAQNYEVARSQDLDNRYKAENVYFEMRKMNREYVAAERGPKPTSEQMFRLAKERAPNRLNANQLDPLTGQISWPVILEEDAYKAYREKLDELFMQRAHYNGQMSPAQYSELQKTTRAMEAELKKHIKEYAGTDYSRARSLLESLSYEATLTAG